MSTLTDSIKDLYEDISTADAKLAADNLVKFFKILEEVETRIASDKQRREPKNENIRSTHLGHQTSGRISRFCKLCY